MANQKAIIRPTLSGRAYEKAILRDGSTLLVADREIHERALKAGGAKLKAAVKEIRGKA